MTALLEGQELSKRFGDTLALDRVSLRVEPGQIVAILGLSGSGKTTLLRCLLGLEQPSAGSVRYQGQDLADPAALERFRAQVGMVFQGGALLNSLSALENVSLAIRARRELPPRVVAEAARMKLAQVGLAGEGHKLPAQLSGGMRKRVAIARAMALDPRLLFVDEPTSGLDPLTAAGIDELLLELREVLEVTVVVVTHDLDSTQRIADRVLLLDGGHVWARGTLAELQRVDDPRLAAFLARRPLLPERARPTPGALLGGGEAA